MWKEIVGFIAAIVLGTAVFMFVIAAIVKAFSLPGERARIEQLREDAAQIDQNSEDVVGQITAANQKIRSNQAYNDIPVICLTIPNGWDKIELIELPESSR